MVAPGNEPGGTMFCSYCGDPATVLDHIVPRAHREEWPHVGISGDRDPMNLTPACRPCNSAKNAHDLDGWLLACMIYYCTQRGLVLPLAGVSSSGWRVGRSIVNSDCAPWVHDRAVAIWLAFRDELSLDVWHVGAR